VCKVKAPWGWEDKNGKLLVQVFRKEDLAYGSQIIIKGKLHKPYNFSRENKFSYKEYLGRREIHYILSVKKAYEVVILSKDNGYFVKEVSLRIRNFLKRKLEKELSFNEAAIMAAILLGDRANIPKHVRELFVRTGTVHILAISGLHVSIVAGLILLLLKVFPTRRSFQFIFAAILIVCYAFITGGRPSVIRATIMTVVFLFSFVVERETESINTMCFAAFAILLHNPLCLFDIGFQLSFVCVFSILMLSPKIEAAIDVVSSSDKHSFFRIIKRSFSVSLAVWFGVAGMIAYYFNIITPITVFANLIVVPLMSVIVALGCFLLLSAFIAPLFSGFFAACIKTVLNLMVGTIFVFDKIPYSYIMLNDVSVWLPVIYYSLILVAFFLPFPYIFGTIYKLSRRLLGC